MTINSTYITDMTFISDHIIN